MPVTTAIIQARMGSTRLPGKVAMLLGDRPVLAHVIERCCHAGKVDQVVVATTGLPEDDRVVQIARDYNVEFYRGSKDDVLSRYYQAARRFQADPIVRITADCPLLDPSLIDRVIQLKEETGADYASNTVERTFPRGVDVSVFSFATLEKMHQLAKESWQREHVTPFVKDNPHMFSRANLSAGGRLRRPDLRITVDTEEDLMLIRAVYYFLGKRSFQLENIIALLEEQPWLPYINRHIRQKGENSPP